jgi:hypothetical protein
MHPFAEEASVLTKIPLVLVDVAASFAADKQRRDPAAGENFRNNWINAKEDNSAQPGGPDF